MDGSEKEEVLSAVKELQRKVDALSAPLEDALAHRLFLKTHEELKKWFFLWMGMISVLVIVLGYQSINEIKEFAKKEASAWLSKKTIKELKKELSLQITKQISENETKIDASIHTAITDAGTAKPNAVVPQAPAILTGFAFYGIQADSGGWEEKHFKPANYNENAFPKKGDILLTTSIVTVREGMIKYSDSKGWYNTKSKGLLKSNSQVKVLEVLHVDDNPDFVWIRLEGTSK